MAGRRAIATRDAIEEVLTAVVDVVPGLFTGSGDLTGNTGMQVKSLGGAHARRRDRPRDPLRHPRARHGRGRQRHGGVGPGAVRRHVLRVQRLHAARGAARRDHADEGLLRVDARLGRRRRGRPDAPADRAARVAARDAGAAGHPPRRRQRGRGRVEVHLDGDGPTALLLTRQKIAGARRHGRARRRRRAARRVRARRRRLGPARPRAHRYRFRGAVCVAARRAARERGLVGARRVDAVVGAVRGAARRVPRRRCSRPTVPTLAVEAGVRFGWERYADDVVSIDRFGASAPGDVVMRELGITPEHAVERALALLERPALRRN